MIEVATWWVALQAAGLAGAAPTYFLLHRLPDRGFAFVKPLGLLAWGYGVWLLASLHVLPNSRLSIIVAWLLLTAAGGILLRPRRAAALAFLRERRRYVLMIEAVFLVSLVVAAFLRSYTPDIAATEKPMDFAMLNAVLRSDYFPPQDPWLAGYDVSYYYGGYVLHGILTSITATTPSVAYNLALAATVALASVAIAGVVWNLLTAISPQRRTLPLVAAVIAPLVVLALGSGEGVLELLAAHGWGGARFWEWWNIEDLRAGSTRDWYPGEFFFWWRASRTTPDTIVEFPFFSLLLGDLHPHVMALPFGFCAISIALARLVAPIPVRGSKAVLEFLVLALFLGSLAWVNTWDLPTFGVLVLVATALRLSMDGELRLARFTLHSGALILLAVVVFLPFYVSFRSQASGLLPDRSPGTRPVIATLLWLPFITASIGLIVGRHTALRRLSPAIVLAPFVVLAAWSVGLFAWEGPAELRLLMSDRGAAWWTVFGYLALAGALFAVARETASRNVAGWTLTALCGGTGALLLAGAELFYIRDVFDNRMNTVFKLSYQAWPLLAVGALGGAAALWDRMASEGRRLARLGAGIAAALALAGLAGGATYTVTATMNRTSGFTRPRTLDGLAFLRRGAPGEHALVGWLASADPSTRLLEGNGRDYGPSGRVSSRTGLQTVIGWVGHELQWRGSKRPYEGRFEDVEAIYSTRDITEAIALLDKYGVDLVVVGSLERDRYPRPGLRKFEREFEKAFESGEIVVYRVPQ